MIKAVINENRKHHTIAINGHAGGGEKGEDLPCAAVSSLVYAVFEEILRLNERKKCKISGIKIEDGDALLAVDFKADSSAAGAWKVMIVGLELIKKVYPDNIEIIG